MGSLSASNTLLANPFLNFFCCLLIEHIHFRQSEIRPFPFCFQQWSFTMYHHSLNLHFSSYKLVNESTSLSFQEEMLSTSLESFLIVSLFASSLIVALLISGDDKQQLDCKEVLTLVVIRLLLINLHQTNYHLRKKVFKRALKNYIPKSKSTH